jgi:hypothetical protein
MPRAPQDLIICSLVKKKKQLLNQLLVLSIQSTIDEQSISAFVDNREKILSALSINDQSLSTRENELGITARKLEARLFNDIEGILNAIENNNNQTIGKLEREMKALERERSRLTRENKLSGYITQQNGYQNSTPIGMKQAAYKNQSRLLDGTL